MPGRLLYIAAVFLMTAAAAALFLGTPAECPVGNVDSRSVTYSENTNDSTSDTSASSVVTIEFVSTDPSFYYAIECQDDQFVLPSSADLVDVDLDERKELIGWQTVVVSGDVYDVKTYAVNSVFYPDSKIHTFVAVWQDLYKLSYSAYGLSEQVPLDSYYTNNSVVHVNMQIIPTLENYQFKGWKSADGVYEILIDSSRHSFVMPQEDLDLYAIYDPIPKLTVAFHHDSIAGIVDYHIVTALESISAPEIKTTLDHHYFDYWSSEDPTNLKHCSPSDVLLVTESIDYYPVWQPNEYTITYEDTLSGISEDVKVTYGTEHQIRGISDTDGKVLIRWERTDDDSLTRFRIGDPYGPTEDITLRSVWAPQNVTVTMESEHHEDLVGNVPGGHVLTLPTGADPNFDTGGEFTLMRWMSGDTEYECGSQVELLDHTTFTAVWKRTKAMTPEIVADIPSSLSIGRGEEVLFDIRYEDVIGTETVAWYLNGVPSGEGTSFRLRPDLTTETGTFLVQARVTNVDTAAITTETVEDSSVCTVTVGDVWHLYIHGIPGPVVHYQRGSSTVTLDTGGVDTNLSITGLRHPDGGTLTDVWGGTVVIDVGEHDTVLRPILSDGMCQITYVSHVTDVVTASVGDVITLSQTPEGKEGWDAGDGFLLPGGSRLAISGDITLIAV